MKNVWIIVITVLVTGGLVGGGTYYFVNAKTTKDKDNLQKQITDLSAKVTTAEKSLSGTLVSNSNSNNVDQSIAAIDETADWETFNGTYEGITLKYPSTWKFANKPGDPSSTEWPDDKGPFDGFTLTSPDNFQIQYVTHIGGLGGGCDEGVNCPKNYFYNVSFLPNSNYSNLQIIQFENREQDNVTTTQRSIALWNPEFDSTVIMKPGDTLEGIFYPLYDGRGSVGLSQLSGKFIGSEDYLDLSTAQYFDLTDVKKAIKIFETVHFSK